MNPELLLAHFDRISEAPDAIERLRGFVTDLAVRGKLVGQDPQAEQVASAYVNEPTSDELPGNWRLLNFEKFFDIQGGNQPPKSQFIAAPRPGYVRLFQIRDLGENPVPTYIPVGTTNRFCREGEILIGRYGASVGKIFWAQSGAYNVALAKFIYPEDAFAAEFTFLVLKSDFFQTKLMSASRSAQAGFNKGDLAEINLPLPPLVEQCRIIAKVKELMMLCDQLATAQIEREHRRNRLTASALHHLTNGADLKDVGEHASFCVNHFTQLSAHRDQIVALRHAILDLAVKGKLVEQRAEDQPASELLKSLSQERDRLVKSGHIKGHQSFPSPAQEETPFPIPKSWQWARFIEVAAIQSNLVDPGKYRDSPHIAPDNIESKTGKLLPYETIGESAVFSAKHLFRAGCILYSKIRPALAKVVLADFDGLCSADMYPILPLINREYLHKYMLSAAFVLQSVSEDNRVAMPKINQAALSKIVVPVPPRAEQQRIVSRVDKLMALCDQLQILISINQNRNRALLEALLHHTLAISQTPAKNAKSA